MSDADYTELVIGAGNRPKKQLSIKGREHWSAVTRLDLDPLCEPDVIWDLAELPLPFEDDSFNEIHAYEILEHTGQQGVWRFFFAQFQDLWRILRPNGLLFGSSPSLQSPWLWGDPGHSRVISPQSFYFLDQSHYAQIGQTSMTDYRHVYRGDFKLVHSQNQGDVFAYTLKAIKPSRISV